MDYLKKCMYCSQPFITDKYFTNYCSEKVCKERRALQEIKSELYRLKRTRYISVKNLPKGPNGMTAKFDMITKEVVFKTFDDL